MWILFLGIPIGFTSKSPDGVNMTDYKKTSLLVPLPCGPTPTVLVGTSLEPTEASVATT